MSERVIIDEQGVITIPARFRQAYGLKADDELIVESRAEGILLRPAIDLPIEEYTEERISEFTSDDAAIGDVLDRNR